MTKKNFHCIEGLRAYMAWWVVIGHAMHLVGAPSWLPHAVEKFLDHGDIAVNVFIIVSGFVIAHLVLTARENYLPYIVRRFLRLAPIYFFCVALAFVTTSYYQEIYVDLPWSISRVMRGDRLLQTDIHLWQHLLAHATLLHGIIPDSILKYSGTSILAPAWSLSLEWQFYLVAPGLIYLLAKSRTSFIVTAALMLAGAALSNHFLRDSYQYPTMLLLSLQFFLIGIASRLALDHLPTIKLGALPLLTLMLVAFAAVKSLALIIWAPFFLITLADSGKIKPFGRFENSLAWLFTSNRIIRTLGQISFSTYLVHIPFFCIVAHFWGQFFPLDHQQNIQIAIVIAIAFIPPLSWILYNGIERPFINFGKSLFKNKPPRNSGSAIAAA